MTITATAPTAATKPSRTLVATGNFIAPNKLDTLLVEAKMCPLRVVELMMEFVIVPTVPMNLRLRVEKKEKCIIHSQDAPILTSPKY